MTTFGMLCYVHIRNVSISDQTWCQATWPCSLGGIGLYVMLFMPLSGCCVSYFALCSKFFFSFVGLLFLSLPFKGIEKAKGRY